jgi:hypothetical protein
MIMVTLQGSIGRVRSGRSKREGGIAEMRIGVVASVVPTNGMKCLTRSSEPCDETATPIVVQSKRGKGTALNVWTHTAWASLLTLA